MKKQCFVFASSLTVLLISVTAVNGQSIITNTVLTASDVPGMEITRTATFPWGYVDLTLDPPEIDNLGIQQTIKTNNYSFTLFYSEFPSIEFAQQGADLYMKIGNILYKKGMWWRGLNHRKIGDMSWYNDYGGNVLVIISGTTCFSVRCSGGDRATRKKLCEQLAIKIDNKIKNGSHVIVSNENPPPATAPSP